MKTKIYCKTTARDTHSFYLDHQGQRYFLFTQKYRRGVHGYYGKGVPLGEALNFAKAHKDGAIIRTMEKLPMYIKYLEKEYSIEVLEKTKKRNQKSSSYSRKAA